MHADDCSSHAPSPSTLVAADQQQQQQPEDVAVRLFGKRFTGFKFETDVYQFFVALANYGMNYKQLLFGWTIDALQGQVGMTDSSKIIEAAGKSLSKLAREMKNFLKGLQRLPGIDKDNVRNMEHQLFLAISRFAIYLSNSGEPTNIETMTSGIVELATAIQTQVGGFGIVEAWTKTAASLDRYVKTTARPGKVPKTISAELAADAHAAGRAIDSALKRARETSK